MEGQNLKYNYGAEVSSILEHNYYNSQNIKGNWNALWHKSLASLKDGTSLLFQYIFELEHGNNWRNVIYKTPEWTLTDIIMILKIHGQTFVNFGTSLSILKQIIIISELYKDSLNNLTAEKTLKISKVINDFLKTLQKHGPSILTTSSYKPSVDIVFARELLRYNVELSNQILIQCLNEFSIAIKKDYLKNSYEIFDGTVNISNSLGNNLLSFESKIEDVAIKVHNFQLNAKAPEFIPQTTLNNYNLSYSDNIDQKMIIEKISSTKLKYSPNNDFYPSSLKQNGKHQINDNRKLNYSFKKESESDDIEALNIDKNLVNDLKWNYQLENNNDKLNVDGWGDGWL